MTSYRRYNALMIFCGLFVSSLWSLTTLSSNVMLFPRHATSDILLLSSLSSSTPAAQLHSNTDCTLLFFGLPRSYETLALSSIVENVLKPNMKHRCDVYAHAPLLEHEAPGRSGKGGPINGNAIYLLQEKVHELYNNSIGDSPFVSIITETEESFWQARGDTIEKYRTTIDNATGKLLYFPWARSRSYKFPTTMDNMVRQWHSIDAVWKLMEQSSHQKRYKRVGMFRSDVFFTTPIDIYHQDQNTVVLPGFAMYPVNDRMIIGDYESVKIWATQRFSRIDDYVRHKVSQTGIGMQSETFLSREILPAVINTTNTTILHDAGICFWRVRADQSVWISDCEKARRVAKESPPLPAFLPKNKTRLIEKMTGLSCQPSRLNRGVIHAVCHQESGGFRDPQ